MIRITLAVLTFMLSKTGPAETLLVSSRDGFEDAVDAATAAGNLVR